MMETARKIWKFVPYRVRLLLIRTFQDKFTVSVVALVENDAGMVLVLDHYLRPGSTWGLPGGFIEPKEPPETAIKRELKEETGLDIVNVTLLEIRTIRRHIEILFRAKAEGEPVIGSREIRGAGWFPADSLPEDMSDHQKETVRRIVSEHGSS